MPGKKLFTRHDFAFVRLTAGFFAGAFTRAFLFTTLVVDFTAFPTDRTTRLRCRADVNTADESPVSEPRIYGAGAGINT